MRCARIDTLIERYVDGRLSPRLLRAVEGHSGSCPRCRIRIEESRRMAAGLAAEPEVPAPVDLSKRIMDAVYREQWSTAPAGQRRLMPGAMPARVYRRLGFSFLAAAAILAGSLFIPRFSYPALLSGESLAAGLSGQTSPVVKNALGSAGNAVRGILHGQGMSESTTQGGTSR